MDAPPPAPTTPTRRRLLQQVALALLGLPVLRLGEAVARAERHRQHHRGDTRDIWIGHC